MGWVNRLEKWEWKTAKRSFKDNRRAICKRSSRMLVPLGEFVCPVDHRLMMMMMLCSGKPPLAKFAAAAVLSTPSVAAVLDVSSVAVNTSAVMYNSARNSFA
jgi:hypothetical protein